MEIYYKHISNKKWKVLNKMAERNLARRETLRLRGPHYYKISVNKAWTQVLSRFKSWTQNGWHMQWWESLTKASASNKAERLSLFNHSLETNYHYYHYQEAGWRNWSSHSEALWKLSRKKHKILANLQEKADAAIKMCSEK